MSDEISALSLDETITLDQLSEASSLADTDIMLLQDANGNGKKIKGDKIAKPSDLNNLLQKTELYENNMSIKSKNGNDLNNIKTNYTGFVFNVSHAPRNDSVYGFLEVLNFDGTGFSPSTTGVVLQKWFDYNSKETYTRMCIQNSWSNWLKIINDDQINNVITDANYFTSYPNGNYFAIGNSEEHSPNDGSGLHFYLTSIFGGWFVQICFSQGTGYAFIRNGQTENIGANWSRLANTSDLSGYVHNDNTANRIGIRHEWTGRSVIIVKVDSTNIELVTLDYLKSKIGDYFKLVYTKQAQGFNQNVSFDFSTVEGTDTSSIFEIYATDWSTNPKIVKATVVKSAGQFYALANEIGNHCSINGSTVTINSVDSVSIYMVK